MPIRVTPLVNDCYYHIFNRGVNKLPIFDDSYDYKRMVNLLHFYKYIDKPVRFSKFLLLPNDQRKEIWNTLEKNSKSYVDLTSYCLMPNHFHLLIKQNVENGIVKYLGDFQNGYVKFFNLRNDRVGPLFQGRFKAVNISSDNQLLHVSRYIHLNPSTSNLIKIDQLENYKWSSFPEYLGSNNFCFCEKDIILNNYKDRNAYRKFVFDNAEYQKDLRRIEHLNLES